MAQIIRLRRGTAAQWTASDPTLAIGEPGYETDTGKLKIGDGATAWTSLPYFITEPPSGVYTPTAAGIINVASATPASARWFRIGTQVYVSGQISITPSTGSATTLLTLDVPVATANFSAAGQLAGMGARANPAVLVNISNQTGDQLAYVLFTSSGTSAHNISYNFGYTIQ